MADSTVKELDQLFTQAKSAKSRLIPDWFMNVAYYDNNQWIAWDGAQLYKPKMRKDRLTLTDNRIQPAVRTEIAKLTKTRPVFAVTPRTADEQDVNAAQMSEQLMRYAWRHLHMQEIRTEALLWSRVCGAGFVKIFWDSSLGDGFTVLTGPDGQVLEGQDGRPVRADQISPSMLSQTLGVPVTPKKINQGDVRLEVRSPFQMFIDPIAERFSEAEWVIEETVKSVEYVKQRYGVELPADTPASPGLIEARSAGYQPSTSSYKGVKIREYWCQPCSTHPGGRKAVWCKDRLLEEEGKPFDPQPYVMFSGIPVPGRLFPTSIVSQLRGQQDELNKVKSQIAENRNRVGNPTILASKQAVQDPDKFVANLSTPGGVYFYDDTGTPNAIPTLLAAPALPAYVLDEIQRIEEAMQEISGQHEVSSANVPPGVTAASAINLLLEADDTRMGPAVEDMETQLGRVGSKILNLIANFYTDARTIRIAGDENAWEIFDFRGTMLRDNTHVEVQAGSAFPQSRAAKQAAMQDLLTFFVQSGSPPQGRQLAQFLKDWEVGGAERLLADYTRDETQINRENQKLLQGVPVQINPYDNDPAHITGHEDEQKTLRYESAPPQIQAVYEQHVQAHRDRNAQAQQQQMQLQLQMSGQPQQQGMQAAQAGQQMSLTEQQHQQDMRHQQEEHDQKIVQMRQQAQVQRPQGAGRS